MNEQAEMTAAAVGATAEMVAIFFNTLIERGVPTQSALALTTSFIGSLLIAGK